MTTEIVHFVVTGEFITEKARDFWNDEDSPERALGLLEGVMGLTEAQRLDVVEGRSKLIGDSSKGIQIVPDKRKSKKLKDIVAKLKAERDEARDEREDLVQMATGDTVCMGSPTGLREVPRRKTTRTPVRGKVVLDDPYEFDDVLAGEHGDIPGSRKAGAKPLRIWTQVEKSGYLSGRDQALDDDEDLGEAEEKVPEPPAARKKITTNTGWLSPEGLFYEATYGRHAYVAWTLGLTNNPQNHSVEPAGWARLGVSDDRQYFFGDHTLFTEKQKELILSFCIWKGAEVPYWLRDSLEEK